MFTFTVFTPTYNRANTLHRVYESLKNQTYKNFEWIVVDDGSKDNTAEIVKNWELENFFIIKYIKKENEGKHIAINWAVKISLGEYFIIADSDDSFESNTLERFLYHWDNINKEGRFQEFASVKSLCKMAETGQVVKSFLDGLYSDISHLDMVYKKRDLNEKWDCHRTDILKLYPFPEEHKKLYFSEGTIWNRISRHFKIRVINEPLRIYYSTQDSLMNNKSPNPRNYIVSVPYVLNEQFDYFLYHPSIFIKIIILYTHFSRISDIGIFSQLRPIKKWKVRVLYLLLLPFSILWSKTKKNYVS